MSATTAYRQIFDVDLEPVAGARFQPTGFPDLGPAIFDRPVRRNGTIEWVPALLLESAQSMANRLEAVGWNAPAHRPADALSGLPYVRVVAVDDGRYLTSSRTEAHRLASAFVKDSTLDGKGMREVIRERLGLRDDTPLAPRDVARAVFTLDPLCLVHGVFFADKLWPGQPRIARAVTSFIEAVEVRAANSGGVKRDEVRHQVGESGGATEGYGFVPYHRTEYTAARIQASFALDLAQLRSYGLGEAATEMLATLARWEIRALLDGGLRLRTACDLAVAQPEVADRDGAALPSLADLEVDLLRLIGACKNLVGDGQALEVVWSGGAKKRGKSEIEDASDES